MRALRPLHAVPVLVLALVAGVALLYAFHPSSSCIDDGFIFMRFARNLGQGAGLVWNRGEPPVEGYTSFLYVGLLAGAEVLHLPLVQAGAWLGLLGSAATVLLTWHLAQLARPGHDAASALAVALVGLCPTFLFWTITCMDVPLYTALLAAAALVYLAYLRGRAPAWSVGAVFALAALARPEALALFGVTGLFEGARRLLARVRLFEWGLWQMPAAFSLLYAPYYAWRWWYFGYPLPNTYYAKTGAGLVQLRGGWDYLVNSLSSDYLFGGTALAAGLAVLVAGIALVAGWRGPGQTPRAYLFALLASAWAIVVLDGGDHFSGGRFLMPGLPLAFSLAGAGVVAVLAPLRAGARGRVAALAVVAALVATLAVAEWRDNAFYRGLPGAWEVVAQRRTVGVPQADSSIYQLYPGATRSFTLMGQTLRRIATPGQSIAVVPIGAIGYYSELVVIDMVGLTDPVIAHQSFDPVYVATWRPGHDKGDGAYILRRQPDYIQLVDALTSQPRPVPGDFALQYKSVAELWASPEFHARYAYDPVQIEGGWYYNLYRRVAQGP